MQRKKGSKRIEMIIKMVNKFKFTVVHFARPNPFSFLQSLFPLTSARKTRDSGRTLRSNVRHAQMGTFLAAGNLVPGDPFCLWLEKSGPLARSNDIPVLNGFVNTIDGDQNKSDLSDLTLSMRRVTGSPWIANFRIWTWPEVAIPVANQKDRTLWTRLGSRAPISRAQKLRENTGKIRCRAKCMKNNWKVRRNL